MGKMGYSFLKTFFIRPLTMIGKKVGWLFGQIKRIMVWLLSRLGVNPNLLTFLGLPFNCGAAVAFAYGRIRTAGVIILLAGLFDWLDGEVARISGRVTKFGSFFDSVIDRYSDMVLLLGIIVYFSKQDQIGYIVLTAIVMMGAVLTSYTRARAENFVPRCRVGFMLRPERIITLIIGCLANHLLTALWILAVMTQLAAVQRIYYTWKELLKFPQTNAN